MKAADRTRRLLVATVLGAGILLLTATPAFASHEGTDYDPNEYCHYPDSGMADVEDGPVDEDTGPWGWCVVTTAGAGSGGGSPDSGGGGVGDVGAGGGADGDGIVPAARIDAGGGGAATGGNPGLLAGVLTTATALSAVAARRRR